MDFNTRKLLYTIIAVFGIGIACGQAYRELLKVELPDTIKFIDIDGEPTAYYELQITNVSSDTISLNKIEIINAKDASILLSLQNQDLKNSYIKIGAAVNPKAMQLSPGNSAIIYIEFSLQKKSIEEIAHRIKFEITGKANSAEGSIQTAPARCSLHTLLVLGAPLSSGNWATVYEPSWERGHRRVIYTVNEKARIPGRYAIDFIKIDNQGKYAIDNENTITNWLGYGADVLAVADGFVSSIKDDFSESPTLTEHPEYSADKATGNYISIKIGDKSFAFYEHLKPNSIKVKVGQKVKKGDVIASLGFTGQTTGPHLHFHMADADSPLGAEGIPFVFAKFDLLGSYEDFGNFGKSAWTKANDLKQVHRSKERPIPNGVIKFRPD